MLPAPNHGNRAAVVFTGMCGRPGQQGLVAEVAVVGRVLPTLPQCVGRIGWYTYVVVWRGFGVSLCLLSGLHNSNKRWMTWVWLWSVVLHEVQQHECSATARQ